MDEIFEQALTADGIVLVDKPAGWTSFDVVAKLRGMLRGYYQRKGIKPTKRQMKVGHAGTLDPFATGLLVILLGDATKRAAEFLKLDKTYQAEVVLGKTSTTDDPEGEISAVSSAQPSPEQVKTALGEFTGEITQTPSAFSAIKVNGERAYKLARQGQAVAMPSRTVTIYSVELINYDYPKLEIRVRVSSGTYIRTLAKDIGEALETGAYCQSLRRTAIADFAVANAADVDLYGARAGQTKA